jgi:cytoskeletal protein CcmA (bactofilin family)
MSVGGNVRMFAGKIALGQATDIAGDLKAGGGDVGITGHVAGDVKVAAGRVLFDGRADKSVSIEADELIVGPNAVIGGDLVILGDTKSTVDPAAKVTGQTRNDSSQSWFYGPRVDPRPGQFGFSLFIAGTAILTGIGLMLLGRANFDDAASLARHRPISRFLIGLIVFILLPIAAIILAVTVIGIPLSVGLLLFLPFLVLIGHATASLGIADWILNRAGTPRSIGRSILYLILGAIGIELLGLIPFVGPLIGFSALLAGAGAFLTTLHGRLRRAPGAMAPGGMGPTT